MVLWNSKQTLAKNKCKKKETIVCNNVPWALLVTTSSFGTRASFVRSAPIPWKKDAIPPTKGAPVPESVF